MTNVIGAIEWTDRAAAIVGIPVGIAAVLYSVVQLGMQTHELKAQTKIRSAQRAQDLMKILIDLGGVGVQDGELGPYIYDGKELPTDRAKESVLLMNRAIAYASGYMSLCEIVGWQIKEGQMTTESVGEWKKYFRGLHQQSPAIRQVVERDRDLLAEETRWLFEKTEPIPETLERLGFGVKKRRSLRHPIGWRADESDYAPSGTTRP